MPHVSYLYISSTFEDELGIESEHLTTSIPMALSEMKELEELHLPPPWLTPSLTKVLASLPVLASINTLDVTDTVDPPLASPAQLLGPNDFPSLSKLDLGITLDHALSWFQRCSSTRLLTHLTLFSAEPESKAAYASIIQIISDNMASRLEYLILLIREFVDPPLDLSTIQFADLKPLLACRKLETLNLEFPFPFDIDVEDVISIVESLPSLKELHLNPRPSLTLHHKPSLHISCL
ncbi:hypothetical protein ONZ45_g2565 [Pleurotus djamor]|nr:hypothetical protein ONZ45_g2565 [Pleurotus djamor]